MSVAVVIPYYADQARLDLVLAALELQTLPGFEVVVADDGSPEPPVVGQRPYPVRTVRQDDLGFRAAAARDLGARATGADVLCFLDGDTVPEPGYLAALTGRVGGGPCGTLAVGRRRHADLAGWTADDVHAWLGGGRPGPTELPEPAWLTEAYAATRDLHDADDRSYRFVISAVLALPRELYARAGGFDPSFVGYGGEDWDLAHRCWLAGADLRHVPGAIAWHDGPDFAGRDGDERAVKDAETLQLAHVLTDPLARGGGLLWRHPETVVEVTGDLSAGECAATANALLHGTDAGVWFTDLGAVPAGVAHDPRVHVGAVAVDDLRRCRHRVWVEGAIRLTRPLAEVVAAGPATYAWGRLPLVRVARTRDLGRGEDAYAARDAAEEGITPLGEVTLEALWGGWG